MAEFRPDERVMIDCRTMPSETDCSVCISGRADEVVELAAYHAVKTHGEKDGPELREGLKQAMEPEPPMQEAAE